MAEAGVPLRVAQETLGHSSPSITQATCQHARQDQKHAAVRALEALLVGRG